MTVDDSPVASILEESRVVVCVGSGGVGKTTTAASLALCAAQAGRRALVITIDPAKRLADALGVDELTHQASEVPVDEDAGGSLSAMTLDLTAAWQDLVRRLVPADEAERILENAFFRHLSEDLPGAQEYIACEALYSLAESHCYDLIVLDTPPSANAIDFLDAPGRLLAMLDHDAFRLLVNMEGSVFSKLGLRFLDGASGALHTALSRLTGARLLDDLVRFLVLLRSLYDPFRARTRGFQALLASESTRFVVVTSPGTAPLDEARDFRHLLSARGLTVGCLVVNRCTPAPGPQVDLTDAVASFIDDNDRENWIAAHRTAFADTQRRADTDRQRAESLAASVGGLPVVAVRALEPPPTDLNGLRQIVGELRKPVVENRS